jgi:hypothetical protein
MFSDIKFNPILVLYFYNSVQNISSPKLLSNVVLEQRLRCYQLKYLHILVLHIRV